MLKLEIVTPERRVVDTEADSVTVPTASGEAGILTSHAPLISALKPGVLSYAASGRTERLAVAGGFIEVSEDRVAVLTDAAESAEEIDIDAARSERDDAEKQLAANAAASSEENDVIRERLESAEARLKVAASL